MIAVAIDGPAGAGKTTVARELARRLGWHYIDTGAMYRAVALAVIKAGIDVNDAGAVGALVGDLDIELQAGEVLLEGVRVTQELRRPDVTEASSIVSAHPEVRAVMVARQRRAATEERVVMEGRDIGTVVLPDARVKVFLTASLNERAARRARELDLHRRADSERLKRAIATRDGADSRRSVSPLTQAPDAVVIDSSNRSVDDVVEEIAALVHAAVDRGAQEGSPG